MMWRAWVVTTEQADTPVPLVEAGTRQRVPRAWLAMGVEPPAYDTAHGPHDVETMADAVAWALSLGYAVAPEWGEL